MLESWLYRIVEVRKRFHTGGNIWLVVVALVAAIAAIHSPVVFGGRTLIPIASSSSTFDFRPYGYAGTVPDWTTTRDPMGSLNFSYADDVFNSSQFRAGNFPFWNPYQGLGQPYLADNFSATLYPANWLTTILPPALFDVVYLLNPGLSAFFLVLLLGEFGMPRQYALIAALPVLVSGQSQICIPLREMIASATCFPLLIYGIERGLRQPEWRWRHVVIAAAFYGIVSGGQPQIEFLGIFTAVVFALVRLCARGRNVWQGLIALAPGFVAGLFLSAPVWWTFLEYLPSALTEHSGAFDGPWHLRFESIATFFYPYLYGRVQHYPLQAPAGWSWDRSPGWSQAMCLFLAFTSIGALRRWRPRGLLALWLIVLVVGAKTFGLPIINSIGSLPVFKLIKFPYSLAFLLDFGVAGLAGYGVWFLTRRGTRWAPLVVAWLALSALVMVIGLRPWTHPLANAEVRSFAIIGMTWVILAPLGLWLVQRERPGENVPMFAVAAAGILFQGISTAAYGYSVQTYVRASLLALASFIGFSVLASVARPLRAALVSTVVPLVGAVGLITAATAKEGLAQRYNIFGDVPYTRFLRQRQHNHLFRSLSMDGILQANFAGSFDISSLNVFEAMLPVATAQYNIRLLDPSSDGIFFGTTFRGEQFAKTFHAHRRFFDLVGVRFLVGRGTDPNFGAAEGHELPLVYSEPSSGIRIWENRTALPRAFLVPRIVLVKSWTAAFEAIESASDLRHVAWVESEVELDAGESSVQADFGEVTRFRLLPNDVWISCRAPAAGLLIITDSYAPGWTAMVDGRDVPVLRVDGVFRGVRIPSHGEHEVHLHYRPPHWRLIVAVFAIGVALVAGATLRTKSSRS